MSRERLSIYDEIKIIITLERKVADLEYDIKHAGSDMLADMYKSDLKELKQIISKLK